ncbi:proteasome subunit beta type [Stylonychia lemnae]|uniref:Proteasome subunit beta n=1 Tax=Stylonychia lemnae TaxID=5949 RepID=A0A078A0S1_STYLE|nr:proteasome subunit beta type [Stylonychia lemnae]|eukprot:CDW75801.1 proteasome subunit beta type [Stylonychia lemnae]
MELDYLKTLPLGGFNFDNCIRNRAMAESGILQAPKTMKTGTTICGVLFKDGVVLAADTRATGGSIVGDKNCEKIHNLAPNIFCCGAGTAADCDHVTEMIKRQLELHRLNTHSENRVQMAALKLVAHAFKYGGQIGTHLIVGGVDVKGPQLIECSNDGNMYSMPYHTTGSGSLAAMAIMETRYKENMTREEAVNLCIAAIEAGIYHDLGSGSNVDVCVITRNKYEMLRNIKHDNFKVFSKPGGYQFKKDRVQVVEEFKHKLVVEAGEQPMDLS